MSELSTARRVLLASRPLSWVNTAYPFAAAILVTGGAIDAALVIGTVFFLIPYNLLMYGVNDVFDYPPMPRTRARAESRVPCCRRAPTGS